MVDKAVTMLPREDTLDYPLILETAARLSIGRGCPVPSAGTAGGTPKSAASSSLLGLGAKIKCRTCRFLLTKPAPVWGPHHAGALVLGLCARPASPLCQAAILCPHRLPGAVRWSPAVCVCPLLLRGLWVLQAGLVGSETCGCPRCRSTSAAFNAGYCEFGSLASAQPSPQPDRCPRSPLNWGTLAFFSEQWPKWNGKWAGLRGGLAPGSRLCPASCGTELIPLAR